MDHRNNIDRFHCTICKFIKECNTLRSIKCIPKTKGTVFKNERNGMKKKSLDAHKLWVQRNRPRTGSVNL